jgi:hypothetical protein
MMQNKEDKVYWMPQDGPQIEGYTCPADETFFGGSRGGGKSDCLIGRQIAGAKQWGPYWNGFVIRKKYKDFKEIRRRWDELINIHGLPATRVGGENQINYIRFHEAPYKGAIVTMAAIGSLDMVDDWWGHQFTEIAIDEAQSFPFLAPMIDKLKGSLRSPHGVPCRFFLTGNPGGPGAAQIKAMYVPLEYGGDIEAKEGQVNWVELVSEAGYTSKISRVFIRSALEDNRILTDGDPEYANRLRSIQNEALRAAWVDGRWDVFVGQAFNFTKANILTGNDCIHPPKYAPIFMTMDYGFGAPFSIGWWWVDGDNRLYRFNEWYGCQDNMPNVGIRLTDAQLAEGILEREQKMGILGEVTRRFIGPDSFRKKPDYKGGGQGPSTADEFIAYTKKQETIDKYGECDLIMVPGDADRDRKIRQFRNRLVVGQEGEMPMLMVYEHCRSFIRTIPALCNDEVKLEDLEDGQEDHVYDESCHICQYFPYGVTDEQIESMMEEKKKKASLKKLDTASRAAAEEYQSIIDTIEREEEAAAWLL